MAADTIRFEGYHLPGLQAGVEKLQLTLDLTLPATDHPDPFVSPELTVLISGPRFIFSPAEIYAIFPPRDSFGEWDNVLPHVELTPSTLPWQRASGANDKTMPWLALILLQDDEWTDPSKVVAEKMAWEDLRKEVGLAEEATDHPPEKGQRFPPVQALRIEQSFLQQIMPTADDLRWLTHVRVGHDSDGQDVERAIVVCNRMPRQGARAAAHLISLEQRLASDGSFKFSAASDGKVLLLSIHSWEFTCPADEEFKVSDKALGRLDEPLKGQAAQQFPAGEARDMLYRGREAFVAALEGKGFSKEADKDALVNACHIQSETFKGLMDALDCGWLHAPPREQTHALFALGGVPVAHGLRQGGKMASWYHGPLIADKNLDAGIETALIQTLPVRHADQLLLYNETTRMLDASYAAAWELGRLLAISEPRVSQQIAQWKTSHAREAGLVEQNLWFSHIPFTDSQFVHRAGGLIEGKLQAYFSNLGRLLGVPFQYLVPHESLLPDESLRFFYVDRLWVECLLDGAFSIGRTTRFDLARERGAQGQIRFPHQQERPAMSGVILRSDLVSGWPSLMVEGYASSDPSESSRIELLRYERLGQNVAIAIFGGELKAFRLHLPPESLHCGFSRDASDESGYVKEVKDLADGNELPTLAGPSRTTAVNFGWRPGAEGLRIFVPKRMVDNINRRLDDEAKQEGRPFERVTHAGHLAIQLLEGVPRLQVNVKQP
ncbi:hypothetical protein [Candidatus Amarolinea aalborgensis]|uniref:hypothetical protein n=1 Tax=Candidatus Amarolinea aalborgensis TaxID=2249329 RepID=UPI003BF9E5E7